MIIEIMLVILFYTLVATLPIFLRDKLFIETRS